MDELKVGQVIWIKYRFNNQGGVSSVNHPYLVYDIDRTLNTVELIQLDSLYGKLHKAMMKSNQVIFSDRPIETVITKDSFAQLDNLFKLEYRDELKNYRTTTDTLSPGKLQMVFNKYRQYHNDNHIDENKIVYMEWDEFKSFNP